MRRTLWAVVFALVELCSSAATKPAVVYVLPVRQEIGEPLLYVVRRGVKEAMQNHADLLILDMDTNGGEIDSMLKIIDVLGEFKGKTVTYVNKTAYSAGALIAMATDEIYMAPESVIGAAAPVMLSPGGAGVESMPDTMELKITSAMDARMRAYAERYGHNPDVAEAMIDKSKPLKLGGLVIKKEGTLLTLTNHEAEKDYGNPPKPLLSLGTVAGLPALYQRLGATMAGVTRIEPTGVETLADWILTIRPLLLMIGVIGIYMEFKMPGVVLPGIIGGAALLVYFFGGYVAGLSGLEWLALFVIGVILLAVELFVLPGSTAIGLAGAAAMFIALLMAMVDLYPGGPLLPTLPQLRLPLRDLCFALAGSVVCVVCLARFFPGTRLFKTFVSQGASGIQTSANIEARQRSLEGRSGVTVSSLRPGGKVMFDGQLVDVLSDGEMIESGKMVQVIGSSGDTPLVKEI